MGATPDISTQAFEEYLLGVQSYGTAKKYAKYAAGFLELMKTNDYTSFSKLPPDILADLTSALCRKGQKPASVRVQIFAIMKYLDWIAGKGVAVTKQAKAELPKVHTRMRGILPPEKLTEFFRQADMYLDEPVRTAVMLLPCCGLRANEMVSLKLSDIRSASVTLKGKTRSTLYLKVIGKGSKERTVPLMEEGVEVLTGYLMGWRKRFKKGPWLFPNATELADPGSNHVVDRYLRMGLQTLRESLNMDEDFTPHMMRRTYITMLYHKGLDLAALAKIAGHSNTQTTINHYIVTDPTDSVNAFHTAMSG